MALPDADALAREWARVAERPEGERLFRSRRLPLSGPLGMLLGIRTPDGAWALLLNGLGASIRLEAFETGGVRLTQVEDESGPLIALILEDPDEQRLFAMMCEDLIEVVEAQFSVGDALDAFQSRLDAWRGFLRDRRGMSRSEIIGLLGELVVLEVLAGRPGFRLASWRAPFDGLQDFETDGRALEVKTSVGPASQVTVSRLDQLDGTALEFLALVHVRLQEGQAGRTLQDIIAGIECLLQPAPERRLFRELLIRRGMPPEGAIVSPRTLTVAIDAYLVDGAFPCLNHNHVPAAVLEARYDLSLRLLAAHATSVDGCFDAFLGPPA